MFTFIFMCNNFGLGCFLNRIYVSHVQQEVISRQFHGNHGNLFNIPMNWCCKFYAHYLLCYLMFISYPSVHISFTVGVLVLTIYKHCGETLPAYQKHTSCIEVILTEGKETWTTTKVSSDLFDWISKLFV